MREYYDFVTVSNIFNDAIILCSNLAFNKYGFGSLCHLLISIIIYHSSIYLYIYIYIYDVRM